MAMVLVVLKIVRMVPGSWYLTRCSSDRIEFRPTSTARLDPDPTANPPQFPIQLRGESWTHRRLRTLTRRRIAVDAWSKPGGSPGCGRRRRWQGARRDAAIR